MYQQSTITELESTHFSTQANSNQKNRMMTGKHLNYFSEIIQYYAKLMEES